LQLVVSLHLQGFVNCKTVENRGEYLYGGLEVENNIPYASAGNEESFSIVAIAIFLSIE